MKFRFRRYYLYYLGRVAIFFIAYLPQKIGLFVSGKLGLLAYLILRKYRKIAIDNLQLAFGSEKAEAELKRIAKAVFENLGRNAFELIRSPGINAGNIDRIVEIENPEIAREAFARGRGIIIITAHIGNWELMAATLRLKGYPGVTVGRRIYFDKYDKFLNRLRKIQDVDVIYRDESPRRILKVLRQNRIVGIVADQDVDSVEGVFVNFFGKSAYTPAGPAALAKVSGAALIPTFIVRKNAHHKLIFEDPIELVDTGNRESDLVANTQKWSDVVESYIRRYPEQWVWMHRRWKTRKIDNGK